MEKRQKLPLPPGGQQSKRKFPAAALLVLCCALVICMALYLLLSGPGELGSARAFLNGSMLEIRAMATGRIDYVAQAGQPVSAGEVILKMDSLKHEQAAQEAAGMAERQAGEVPPYARELMLRSLAIPQSEAVLEKNVKTAAEAEKEHKQALKELGERQAMFSLELRRLELKMNRLKEEEARMKSMRVEEILLRESIKEANKKFETASLERAAMEKRLQTRRYISRAMNSLPLEQRNQLYSLEKEFYKMYEAERQIALSSIVSPQNGKVMYTVAPAGSTVREGDTALYILPEGQPDIWVTAYFSRNTADDIELGTPCTISIGGENPITLNGILTEYLPDEQADSSGVPFKATILDLNAAQLAGINPASPVSVTLHN